MTNLTLIGAAALLLAAAPAMAKQHANHRYVYSHQLSRSVYGAYGFYRGDDAVPGNISADFDRRNTFN